MRLAFMGTPDFAKPTLQALVDAGVEVVAVYTQPPARAGRGKSLRKSPVHQLAEQLNIPVYTPKKMREESTINEFSALDLDVAVVVAYGQILPKEILDAPLHGCVNLHASLLPRWRGAAPIHRAIMAGDLETGADIMVMEEGLDTGPVLAEVKIAISDTDTTLSLHDKLATMGAELMAPTLLDFIAGKIDPVPQCNSGVTYAHKIDKAEARIDWQKPALDIDRQVRGLMPFPGAWCVYGGERIKILAGQVVDATTAAAVAAGTVIDDQFSIMCGDGLVFQVDKAQRAGKGAVGREEFLRGFPLAPNSQMDNEG